MRTQDPAFELPDLREVQDLTTSSITAASTLKPTDIVVCLNRGRRPLLVTFDANHREIPIGYFKTEYGAALHFQKKLVVPGTRNIEVGGHVSWIAILGSEDGRIQVDPPEMCVQFTDEELQSYGERIEAIDRSAMSNPADRAVTTIRTSGAGAASRARGTGFKPVIDAGAQASDAAREAAAHVFEPTDEPNAAKLDQAAASVERSADESTADGEVPQPRPMRSQRRR